jgi:hypothetical protein
VLHTQQLRDILKFSGIVGMNSSPENKCVVWTAFSAGEEGKLTEYVSTSRRTHCALTRKEVLKETCQFAKELTKGILIRGV